MILNKLSSNNFFPPPISAGELFSGASKPGQDFPGTSVHRKHFGAKQDVFLPGDKAACVFIMRSGDAVMIDKDVRHTSPAICPSGEVPMFGIPELLGGGKFEIGLRTLSECEFDIIDKQDFVNFVSDDPKVCFRLAAIISSLYQEAVNQLKNQ